MSASPWRPLRPEALDRSVLPPKHRDLSRAPHWTPCTCSGFSNWPRTLREHGLHRQKLTLSDSSHPTSAARMISSAGSRSPTRASSSICSSSAPMARHAGLPPDLVAHHQKNLRHDGRALAIPYSMMTPCVMGVIGFTVSGAWGSGHLTRFTSLGWGNFAGFWSAYWGARRLGCRVISGGGLDTKGQYRGYPADEADRAHFNPDIRPSHRGRREGNGGRPVQEFHPLHLPRW